MARSNPLRPKGTLQPCAAKPHGPILEGEATLPGLPLSFYLTILLPSPHLPLSDRSLIRVESSNCGLFVRFFEGRFLCNRTADFAQKPTTGDSKHPSPCGSTGPMRAFGRVDSS